MADIVGVVDDIFFRAKILETAKHLGIDLGMLTTSEALEAEISRSKPRLIIVDLNGRADPMKTIAIARQLAGDVPILGYLSHIQVDLEKRARAAGCANVMPRSQFAKNLATILSSAKSQSE